MNQAMAYLEASLDAVDIAEMARIAHCSEYHFRRMFSFLSGYSLMEYIRRRRLSLAGQVLMENPRSKVIDVALQFGYESPDAFTKAFYQFHGLTPSEVKSGNDSIRIFMPMTFQLTIQGGKEMDYRIIEKEAFHIVGLAKKVQIQFEGVNDEINQMWQSLTMDDIMEFKELSNIEPRGLISASTDFSDRTAEDGTLTQYIGAATTKDYTGKWSQLPVAAGSWAVFTAVGAFPKALQDTWAQIYAEWLPASGYELVPGPELLWNEHKDTTDPNYKSEIWIPVTKQTI